MVSDCIPVNVEHVLILKQPFTGVIWLLGGMKKTEINDWLGVVYILVKPFREISSERVFTCGALVSLDLNF